jgi:4-hydroxyphenylpyruvate dioxygenase-like putative hemolysin
MTDSSSSSREDVPEASNRLGIDGIEFIEYTTSQPQALGQVLEGLGFRPVARHRSREVTLYRQGGMNLVVNAGAADALAQAASDGQPVISAVALRVQDALQAHTRCIELGAWAAPSQAQAMELHIPAIHGPGGSRFYFVDRWQEFSIYDIDFKPIAGADSHPPALAGLGYFGVVQYIGRGRRADLPAAVQALRQRGVEFVESSRLHPDDRGALTRNAMGTVVFELVHRDA